MKSNKIVDKKRIIKFDDNKEITVWPWNGKKMRWTILLGKSQRNEKINLVIRRSLQVNHAIEKHLVFNPPRLGIIKSTL